MKHELIDRLFYKVTRMTFLGYSRRKLLGYQKQFFCGTGEK
jgi:hypothetical protein